MSTVWVFCACHLFPLRGPYTIVHGCIMPPALLETALVWASQALFFPDVVLPMQSLLFMLPDVLLWTTNCGVQALYVL